MAYSEVRVTNLNAKHGGEYKTGAGTFSAPTSIGLCIAAVQALTDTTITSATAASTGAGAGGITGIAGAVIPAGQFAYGRFTQVVTGGGNTIVYYDF